jgi:hypothetical protein
MLKRCKDFEGFDILATDGEIGSVRDVYFDDDRWTVRYVVVDTGKWLPGRQVLLSPISFAAPDWEARELPVNLTRAQVAESPDVFTHRPISRMNEVELHAYYGYPAYWEGPALWGAAMTPAALAAMPSIVGGAAEIARPRDRKDEHLRSAQEVRGYHVRATDGAVGHVEDFIVSDESWTVRYVIVDTGSWLFSRRVVLAPEWFRGVVWESRGVEVELTREQIASSPEFDPAKPFERSYEADVYRHYGVPPYWPAK